MKSKGFKTIKNYGKSINMAEDEDGWDDVAGSMSKFNSGALINLRLNNLWVLTHNHARTSNYSEWNSLLNRIWCELAADTVEGGEEEKDLNAIEQELSKAGVKNWNSTTGFEKTTYEEMKTRTKQYRLIMKKEIFLRRLQNKQGKGTAYYDNTQDDWE